MNDYTNNQATIHTAPGCTLATSSSNSLGISGTLVGGTVCAAALTGNQGCGVRSPQTNSFGATFNNNNGGVYASKRSSSLHLFRYVIFSNPTSSSAIYHVLTVRIYAQCNGTTMEFRCTSSLATTSLTISPPTRHCLRTGVNQWHSGPLRTATRSSSSTDILRYSTPHSGT